jgi:hypothetical protein
MSPGALSTARRGPRASLAISDRGRAYSAARAGTGRTEKASASATSERPRPSRAPVANNTHETFESKSVLISNLTSVWGSVSDHRCLAKKPSSALMQVPTAYRQRSGPRAAPHLFRRGAFLAARTAAIWF